MYSLGSFSTLIVTPSSTHNYDQALLRHATHDVHTQTIYAISVFNLFIRSTWLMPIPYLWLCCLGKRPRPRRSDDNKRSRSRSYSFDYSDSSSDGAYRDNWDEKAVLKNGESESHKIVGEKPGYGATEDAPVADDQCASSTGSSEETVSGVAVDQDVQSQYHTSKADVDGSGCDEGSKRNGYSSAEQSKLAADTVLDDGYTAEKSNEVLIDDEKIGVVSSVGQLPPDNAAHFDEIASDFKNSPEDHPDPDFDLHSVDDEGEAISRHLETVRIVPDEMDGNEDEEKLASSFGPCINDIYVLGNSETYSSPRVSMIMYDDESGSSASETFELKQQDDTSSLRSFVSNSDGSFSIDSIGEDITSMNTFSDEEDHSLDGHALENEINDTDLVDDCSEIILSGSLEVLSQGELEHELDQDKDANQTNLESQIDSYEIASQFSSNAVEATNIDVTLDKETPDAPTIAHQSCQEPSAFQPLPPSSSPPETLEFISTTILTEPIDSPSATLETQNNSTSPELIQETSDYLSMGQEPCESSADQDLIECRVETGSFAQPGMQESSGDLSVIQEIINPSSSAAESSDSLSIKDLENLDSPTMTEISSDPQLSFPSTIFKESIDAPLTESNVETPDSQSTVIETCLCDIPEPDQPPTDLDPRHPPHETNEHCEDLSELLTGTEGACDSVPPSPADVDFSAPNPEDPACVPPPNLISQSPSSAAEELVPSSTSDHSLVAFPPATATPSLSSLPESVVEQCDDGSITAAQEIEKSSTPLVPSFISDDILKLNCKSDLETEQIVGTSVVTALGETKSSDCVDIECAQTPGLEDCVKCADQPDPLPTIQTDGSVFLPAVDERTQPKFSAENGISAEKGYTLPPIVFSPYEETFAPISEVDDSGTKAEFEVEPPIAPKAKKKLFGRFNLKKKSNKKKKKSLEVKQPESSVYSSSAPNLRAAANEDTLSNISTAAMTSVSNTSADSRGRYSLSLLLSLMDDLSDDDICKE